MKAIALIAVLLAFSSAPASAICKHHVANLASVSDFAGPAPTAPAPSPKTMIEKCFPHCNG